MAIELLLEDLCGQIQEAFSSMSGLRLLRITVDQGKEEAEQTFTNELVPSIPRFYTIAANQLGSME